MPSSEDVEFKANRDLKNLIDLVEKERTNQMCRRRTLEANRD